LSQLRDSPHGSFHGYQGKLEERDPRIASILDDYGFSHGWGRDSGQVYIDYDEEWGTIRGTYVARGFKSQDNFERFESVMNHLEAQLADDPALLQSIRLVVRDTSRSSPGSSRPAGRFRRATGGILDQWARAVRGKRGRFSREYCNALALSFRAQQPISGPGP
jgi:hypothetical protein